MKLCKPPLTPCWGWAGLGWPHTPGCLELGRSCASAPSATSSVVLPSHGPTLHPSPPCSRGTAGPADRWCRRCHCLSPDPDLAPVERVEVPAGAGLGHGPDGGRVGAARGLRQAEGGDGLACRGSRAVTMGSSPRVWGHQVTGLLEAPGSRPQGQARNRDLRRATATCHSGQEGTGTNEQRPSPHCPCLGLASAVRLHVKRQPQDRGFPLTSLRPFSSQTPQHQPVPAPRGRPASTTS